MHYLFNCFCLSVVEILKNLSNSFIKLEAHSQFKLQLHEIMGRVQQKVQFSHFFSSKMQNLKGNYECTIYEIMTSVFDTHPPLIYVLISYEK